MRAQVQPALLSASRRQIIGPLEEEEVFNQDDFLLLESIILKTSGERIKSKVQQFGTEEDRYSTSYIIIIIIMVVVNFIS